jgi:hypothetical protein
MRAVVVLTFVLLGISGCQNGLLRQEMGKSEQDYVQRYGPATTSPMTPDQAAFNVAPGTRLVVRFAGGRSVEELWLLAPDLRGLPEPIAAEARKIQPDQKPVRTIVFESESSTPVEFFEQPSGDGTLQFERRAGQFTRVALCAKRDSCNLLNQVVQSEKATDDLMGRAAAAMRRQGR